MWLQFDLVLTVVKASAPREEERLAVGVLPSRPDLSPGSRDLVKLTGSH